MTKLYTYITNYFTEGHERSINTKRNILFLFIIKGLNIIISLILVSMTISYVNPERYGIWLTLSSIIIWISFFDIGFGNGLRNKFAEAKAKGDTKTAQIYISTTYAFFILIFTTLWLVFIIVNHFIDWPIVLNASNDMKRELNILASVLISYFCLQFFLKLITIILTADQKPSNASIIDLIGQSISLLVIFILTKYTKGSLIFLGLAMGIAPIVVLIISSFYLFRYKYSQYRPKLSCVRFAEGKSIMNLGIRFFVVQIATLVIYQTNNIVIAHLFGPKDVTVYNIAYKYFSALSMVFFIILTPFWSAFTDAYVRKDINWMETSIKKLEKIWLMITLCGILMLLISKYIYLFWIGDKVIIPFSISAFTFLYFLVYSRFSLYIYLLNGIGKIKLQLIINVILALLNIPVVLFLGFRYGLAGVIVGNIIISLPHVIYSPIQLKMVIKNQAFGIWNK